MLAFYLSMIETQEDKRLFERLYIKYKQDMYKYALQITEDPGDAEDVVHEVFLSLVQYGVDKIRFVEQDGNAWAYLSAAVRNQSYTLLRRQRGIKPIDPALGEYAGSTETDDKNRSGSDYSYLVETIRALDPIYADVLYYALVQEMPSGKIADLLKLKPATVRKRISRGKSILREKLGKDFIE